MSQGAQDPLLSQEETDALLDAMREGGNAQPDADEIDLTSPDRPLRAAMGHADRTAEVFVRAASRCFLRTLGCSTNVEEEPCEIIPFSVLASALQPGSAVAILKAADGSSGFMILGPTLVGYVLDRQMGAPLSASDSDARPPSTETLSNLDQRIVAPFMQRLAETFSECWCGQSAFRVQEVLARTADMPQLPQFEPLLRVATKAVPIGAAGDEILVALTAQAVLATVPRREDTQPEPSATDQARMRRRLANTEVECVSLLGTARGTIREVLGLSAGDVLRLESVPGKAVPVHVGDVVVAHGMPVVHHGNLSLEITKTR